MIIIYAIIIKGELANKIMKVSSTGVTHTHTSLVKRAIQAHNWDRLFFPQAQKIFCFHYIKLVLFGIVLKIIAVSDGCKNNFNYSKGSSIWLGLKEDGEQPLKVHEYYLGDHSLKPWATLTWLQSPFLIRDSMKMLTGIYTERILALAPRLNGSINFCSQPLQHGRAPICKL